MRILGLGFRSLLNAPALLGKFTSRYFTTVASSLSQHWTFPAVTLTGDYKQEVTVYFTGSVIICIGNTSNFDSRFIVNANGSVSWRPTTLSNVEISPAASVPVNKLSVISVERIGSAGTIKVNGTTVLSDTVATGNCVVNGIGISSTLFSDGISANVKITDAGTLVRKYDMREDWVGPSTVLVDTSGNGQDGTFVNGSETDAELFTRNSDGDFLGVEVIVNGTFDTDTDWNKGTGWTIAGGEALANLTASFDNLIQTNAVVVGNVYSTEFTVRDYVAGSLALNIGVGTDGTARTADGVYTEILGPATGTSLLIFNIPATTQMSIDDVSMKRFLEVA